MPDIATLTDWRTLELPEPIANRFHSQDRFVVWVEGDTLHLKKVLPSVAERVTPTEADEAPSLEEINELVHEVRRQRHAAAQD